MKLTGTPSTKPEERSVTELIAVDVVDRVLCIRLNRPAKKNAINSAMYAAMNAALGRAREDADIRVVLFVGSETCFTSGNDIEDFLNPGSGAGGEFIKTLPRVEKPMVAAVAGPAVGIGTTLLLHCDLVYASENAYLKLPFVDLGIVPEAGSSLLLPRIIGHQRACQALLLGETLKADLACTWGLINEVVPAGQVESRALAAATLLAKRAPAAVQATKRLLRRAEAASVSETIDVELTEFVARLQSPEAREALQAFMEKRAPKF
jgi:enoyl-CoA hydratase/carnithine racemase